jgi:hypothetical protein
MFDITGNGLTTNSIVKRYPKKMILLGLFSTFS